MKNKKIVILLAATCISTTLLVGCGAQLQESNNADSSIDSSAVSKSEDKNQTGIAVDESIISWANLKYDNVDAKLTDNQKEVVKYFDNDYIGLNNYDNLQKYPKVYRNAQISFTGTVRKILNANDDEFECLVQMNGYPKRIASPSANLLEGDMVVVKGKQTDERITVDESLAFYGRYLDVKTYEIDGKTDPYPTVSVNYTVPYSFEIETEEPRFDLSTIESVAKTVFGNDIKVKEPVFGTDYQLDALHYPQYYFYLVTPDNQTNSNFSSFEFSRLSGNIRDAKSSEKEIRYFNVASDFQHYIVSVYETDLHKMYLEYYDRDFKKVWSREFNNVDTVPYDYTAKNIYLVADNDLYIIDSATGKDVIEPTMVGQKVNVNVTNEGIVLIGKGNKDNIMKTDKNGKILWKTSADLDVTECRMVQIIDDTIVASIVHSKYVDEPKFNTKTMTEYTVEIVAIDKDGTIINEFTDTTYSPETGLKYN